MLLGKTNAGFLYVFESPTRILVVDDDPIMREIAVGHLDHPGGEIVTAADGEEALAILQRDARFDIVLCDLEMPRMNGFALLAEMRRDPRMQNLPVVVITSRDDVFAVDRAYEVGATSFVAKPVNWRLLGYQLRYVLRGARMEAITREARARTEEADRLKESLLSLLQHETRTPLNAIIGYSELLQASLDPDADPRDYLDGVITAARGLNETLQRVFAFAQTSAGTVPVTPERLCAADLLEDEVHRRRRAADAAGITLDVDADPALFVTADQHLVAKALGELVANALAHTPRGGRVRLTARGEAGEVALGVADDGPGLDAETLARCTQPFLQAENVLVRRAVGLGLGLAMARRIAELNGGHLFLESAPGRGLAARIVLPAARLDATGLPREAAE
ncbi:hybrid sensor histidine kinase/response regulator [Salinarimonas rosea]|uniref:hybrid sensor histidine kinase/response regulator n=1 Tax=Salinarimonas rosea TaxID=552063 RepID=UPI00040D6CF6|nr:hybrid sensor histidine kinase/response regulator [Salinarimonas rosea]